MSEKTNQQELEPKTSDDNTLSEPSVGFKDLGLDQDLLENLDQIGFSKPTEIQSHTIPHILAGKDLIAQAQTGSGKTACFALPAIQKMEKSQKIETLVLVPTRELAQQVVTEFKRLGTTRKTKVACIVGGLSYRQQIYDINNGAQVVVATPGRLLDLLKSNRFKEFQPKLVVLDEADEMLSMGFIEDIQSILEFITEKRQTVVFSATFPEQIMRLAKKYLNKPEHVQLVKKENPTNTLIEQLFYLVKEKERQDALIRLIEFDRPHKAIVFCRTKSDVDQLSGVLTSKKIKTRALHGDLGQSERERVLRSFRNGDLSFLVATDIASRGLDIDDLSHVYNFHIPENHDRYLHRIGRTGRAGRSGKSITFASKSEWLNHFLFRRINKKNVKLATVPSKSSVEKKLQHQFVEQVNSIKVDDQIRKVCKDMLASNSDDGFDFMCKLYAHSILDQKVLGPDRIGVSQEEIDFITSSRAQKRSKGSSSPFGRRNDRRRSSRPGRFANERSARRSRRKDDSKRPSRNTKAKARAF